MSFRRRSAALALLALGAATAGAQYSTPVGSGAAKPKTLRATAVLEWTGPLEKPSASRLMPIAVWDGEHYQPAGLYLARPAPLAFDTGTQYELERGGEPAGLFNVRAAAQLHGEWIGLGKFQPEAAPPPPPKLKPSKHLPVLSTGKSDSSTGKDTGSAAEKTNSDRPTLHRKTDDTSTAPSGSSSPGGSSTDTASPANSKNTSSPSPGTSADTSSDDSSHPTLHRRTESTDSAGSSQTSGSPGSGSPGSGSTGSGSPGSGSPGTPSSTPSSTGASTGSSGDSDSDRPTLHRHSDTTDTADTSSTSKSPDADADRPTLHKHEDTAGSDPDRPTLHRARSGGDAVATSIDPDRPRLRYGASDDREGSALPARLEGAPPTMQQLVAVSDSATGELRPYQYHWPSPDDAAKMQTALAALAVQAIQTPTPTAAKPAAQFGPSARAAARKPRQAHPAVPAVQLQDERFTTYELSFSGGPTMVYSAHSADQGPQRVYVTLIAQPDFAGKPQVLLQQVARANRLDEVPAMQLVDALDTDNDQRAELIFQLNGAAQAPPVESTPSAAASDLAASTATDNATLFAKAAAASAATNAPAAGAAVPEREFAIYKVGNGKAVQVFTTGPLP